MLAAWPSLPGAASCSFLACFWPRALPPLRMPGPGFLRIRPRNRWSLTTLGRAQCRWTECGSFISATTPRGLHRDLTIQPGSRSAQISRGVRKATRAIPALRGTGSTSRSPLLQEKCRRALRGLLEWAAGGAKRSASATPRLVLGSATCADLRSGKDSKRGAGGAYMEVPVAFRGLFSVGWNAGSTPDRHS